MDCIRLCRFQSKWHTLFSKAGSRFKTTPQSGQPIEVMTLELIQFKILKNYTGRCLVKEKRTRRIVEIFETTDFQDLVGMKNVCMR